jgi:hypothetical protein
MLEAWSVPPEACGPALADRLAYLAQEWAASQAAAAGEAEERLHPSNSEEDDDIPW